MGNNNSGSALQQYKTVGVASAVEEASPHRLVQMLLEGAIARVTAAQGHMARGDIAHKGESISMAIGIIDGLKGSLDMEGGGEIAANLAALYDYMAGRLLEGNRDNRDEALEEVLRLLKQIKEAWDGIRESIGSADTESTSSTQPNQAVGV